MSRMIWGHAPDKPKDGFRQTRLDAFASAPSPTAAAAVPAAAAQPTKREAEENDEGRPQQPPRPQPAPALDEGILYGPSGGGNRETQGRGRPMRPFMNGKERSSAVDQPYSRTFVSEWREERRAVEDGHSNGAITSMDDEITVRAFIAPNCPRDLFRGQAFFLNSCDADPLVSIFQLEKIIRYLGGSTSMSASGRVAYVVTQHLSYAKEEKVRAALNRGANKGLPYKLVHPHFILECAKKGTLVPIAPYLTQVAAARPVAALETASSPVPAAPAVKSKVSTSSKKAPSKDVIEID